MSSYIYIVLIGYACGCISVAHLIASSHGKRIATVGNGNPGTSNVTLYFGIKAGIICCLCDVLKAVLAGIIVSYVFPHIWNASVYAGCSAVVGHMFPFYSKFKGGKGFASYIGMAFLLEWRVALIVLAMAIGMALGFDYIVVATFFFTVGIPICALLWSHNWTACLAMFCVTAIIYWKHIPNMSSLRDRSEPHISDIWRKKSDTELD